MVLVVRSLCCANIVLIGILRESVDVVGGVESSVGWSLLLAVTTEMSWGRRGGRMA